MNRWFVIVPLLLVWGQCICQGVVKAAEPGNPSVAFIQRTMGRAAASTPGTPATIRWMFYGQSITAQAWTERVQQDLTQRFPAAKFVFHKPAIGGFTSPSLIRTAEHDLYPWYPDLLVFHVYGPVDKYEEIIRSVRRRTTAEIVLWTSHLNARDTLDKNPDQDARIEAIRDIAKRYDCMLIDVRKKWIAHLKENSLEPTALLRDSVHLNDDGVKLLADFIAPELLAVPGLKTTPQAGTVTSIASNAPVIQRQADGSLTLPFTGNRVVAIAGDGGSATVEVLLDDEPLAGRRACWAVSRPSKAPRMWMPAIKQVSFEQPPVAEDWTLTCLPESSADGKRVRFRVEGSVTGADGEGLSDERFVSRSGRVVIEPADWHLAWCLQYKKLELPAGFQVTWKTYPQFVSAYEPQPPGTETVLVQHCSNEQHRLTLRGATARSGITAFRIDAPAGGQQ